MTDPGWLQDTDGDGTNDCDDADDDGDQMTDEYEDVYAHLYNRLDRDRDDDGEVDVLDVVPNLKNGAEVDILAAAYGANSNCDVATGADPFIPSTEFWVKIGAGGQISLKSPPNWKESDHTHDRATNAVSDLKIESVDAGKVVDGLMGLPEDIFDWPIASTTETPSVTILIGLLDHDHASDDERIDLRPGSGTTTVIRFELTTDQDATFKSTGDSGGCDGTIGFTFDDTLPNRAILTAVYHRQNPSALIGYGDV